MTAHRDPEDELLTIEEAAAYLRVPVNTLRAWRYEEKGPLSATFFRRVMYRRRDLDAWVNAQFSAGRSQR